jgi:hypothetical protein
MAETEVDMVWEDPPGPVMGQAAKARWFDRLMPLTEEPERWARINECETAGKASAQANYIRRGKVKLPNGVWEAVSRTVTDGEDKHFYVYARWMGLDGQGSTE